MKFAIVIVLDCSQHIFEEKPAFKKVVLTFIFQSLQIKERSKEPYYNLALDHVQQRGALVKAFMRTILIDIHMSVVPNLNTDSFFSTCWR